MAVQIASEELKGCKTYFGWLRSKVDFVGNIDSDNGFSGYTDEISKELCQLLHETDFVYELKKDEIRAQDAMNLRHIYAEETGKEAGKTAREIDRIWKSLRGKCSVFELLVSLSMHLDAMLNEGEAGDMTGVFYRILVKNLELDAFDDEDFDHNRESVEPYWKGKIDRFLKREYGSDGTGGLFPLTRIEVLEDQIERSERIDGPKKDQRKVAIWDQMAAWVNEHLDENGEFFVGKSAEK